MARVRAFPAAFVLVLLLVATGGMMGTTKVAEARICATPSGRFHGLCFSDRNCASVCHGEGFTGGDCHGFRRRCFCTKPC
ncbi:hypothetical protein Taro_037059 [Colocasia esculenta]|uniref:Knottins-like domain-containing protein n=1 Tax=Colocasia esculenta TaxID=4460 RepID=A0A843W8L9_COLES|nr:hypothetical protein [Colocasia esculenta]